jgi:hypothetical protein
VSAARTAAPINVLTSSNLLVPLSLWTSIATNHFDGTGHFIFTNAAQQFYLLQLP